MTRINGKFAPITDELGYDPRFKELKQLEQLLYLLIIHTTHMTRHQAPTDPRYYQLQYGLKAKKGAIVSAMCRLTVVYPKLKCTSAGGIKTLSLLNSPTYKSQICLEEETEEETDTTTSDPMIGFDLFWGAFPKKVGRGAAEKSWAKIKPDQILLDQILKAIGSAKDTEQWKKDKGQFIPHPTTWLNQKRWLDVHTPVKKGYDIWQTKPVTIPK
jgi:hypothetical protein